MNDTLQVNLFSGNQRKSFLQVKPHLVSKTTQRTCTCTITFGNPIIQNMLKQIKILLHGCKLRKSKQ